MNYFSTSNSGKGRLWFCMCEQAVSLHHTTHCVCYFLHWHWTLAVDTDREVPNHPIWMEFLRGLSSKNHNKPLFKSWWFKSSLFPPKHPLCSWCLGLGLFLTTEQSGQCVGLSLATDRDQRSKQPTFNHWPLTNPEEMCMCVCEGSCVYAKMLTAFSAAIWTSAQVSV